MEWFLFLPQIRVPVVDIVERARAAESAGFTGMAFTDHLLTPGDERVPIWEAMTVATWVAAHTDRLRIGQLVLCDAFRHPAVLAKQAVTLQEASGGRFELGLGTGSVPRELVRFGITEQRAVQRRERLRHSLEVLAQCWGTADATEYAQAPAPSTPIPLVLGGVGAPMLELVRTYATWWNLWAPDIDRLPELLPSVGPARVSVQQLVGFVGRGRSADEVYRQSAPLRSHIGDNLVCGDADRLAAYFTGLARGGVERFYVWFSDFAPPKTLAEFGETVIPAVERALG